MDNKNRFIIIISSLFLILIMSSTMFFIFEDMISIVKLGDEITFSWKLFLFFFASPLPFYMCVCAIYYSITSKPARLNNTIIKIFIVNFFIFLFLSFPFSWYLDSKLRREGYVICEKTSFVSPNKYVKYPSLCR
ncbi:DUF1240 domain-containing protein [Xenorhabdus sp. XENO-7]|uniref:DUF1240 domain-containing protein n=1 Tax=Xenorhabdus aichiensis TaxID=3025874 RepID=A0ABT5M6L6_9GAMM|nr:DUF1240 domain-containing protein [Xenorhabdus aichiensis]MDC9623334.1 DUF1240 domain-containing protein [Xenorhabdus aichiensis]